MSKILALILALPAMAFSTANAANAVIAPYCPPGAKYCPAPGAENTVFLDTHFGMDAETGVVVAYKGTSHPDVVNGPGTVTEEVLFTSPPISVENIFVPNPNLPASQQGVIVAQAGGQPVYRQPPQIQVRAAAPAIMQAPVIAQPAPAIAQTPVMVQAPARASSSSTAARSEVANVQTSRSGSRPQAVAADERVPWWKGGLWRNRGEDEGEDPPTSANAAPAGGPPRAGSASAGGGGGGDNGMWSESEYSGYNQDGSLARPTTGPYAAPQFGAGQQQQFPAQQQFGSQQPFPAQPQPQYADPYQAPLQTQTYPEPAMAGGFVGDAYTLPNSPPPTSPYQPGYVYPGTDISYETTQQGFQGYYQDPNMPAAGMPAVGVTTSGMPIAGMAVTSPTPYPAAAPAGYQAPPSVDAQGSPQFENAVRMVKDNRFSEAKNLLASETGRNPGNAAAWRWLADCHYNLLELDDAISCYQRAVDRDPNDYYAQRGLGFSFLHRGHEYWRRMQEEVGGGQKEAAAATFAQAHENYKKSLEVLGLCLRRAPNDGEAIYGEAMAAEGASRKLYSNAISYLKLGPEQRSRAELFAENCLTVINKGIERARDRSRQNAGDAGPRALLGGLYLRKAILYHQLGKTDLALLELRNSRDVQQSILDDIDQNNATAQKNIKECQAYWDSWGGNSQAQAQ